MPEVEYVIDNMSVEYEGISNIRDLYDFVRSSIEQLGYGITEKEQAEKGSSKFSMKCKAEKVVDDYTKFIIKFKVASTHEEVEVKNKKMHKGTFTIVFKALIERDFQDKWATPTKRFFKGVYEKFVNIKKKESYEADLKEDVYKVAENVKTYFGMHKL